MCQKETVSFMLKYVQVKLSEAPHLLQNNTGGKGRWEGPAIASTGGEGGGEGGYVAVTALVVPLLCVLHIFHHDKRYFVTERMQRERERGNDPKQKARFQVKTGRESDRVPACGPRTPFSL